MSAKRNLLKYIEKKGITKTDFYKKTGLSNGFLDKNNNISSQNIEIIIYNYPDLDLNWLITGAGEMLRSQNVQKTSHVHINYPVQNNQNQHKDTKKLIPLYSDVVSIGGNNDLSANMEANSQPIEYIDTGDWFRGATAAIRHYGDSMVEYPPGCILALKEISERQLMVWGEDYVIETNEYRITKCIQYSDSKDYIVAYSSNNETYPDGRLKHEPLTISWSDIHKIFLVLGYVVKKNGGTMVYNSKK